MDMVLNHAYGTNPFVMMYWNSAKNQPAADNPWFNQTSPNTDYSWGNDFNHESPATKRFVDSVNHYWISQYKVDGFRFDFTKGFTNTPGNGYAYDQSRINILERMAHHIWSYKPNAYVILEHFTANSEEKVLTNYGIGATPTTITTRQPWALQMGLIFHGCLMKNADSPIRVALWVIWKVMMKNA